MKALRAAALALAWGAAPAAFPADATAPAMPANHPPAVPGAAAPRLAAGTVMARAGVEVIVAGDVDAALGSLPSPDRLEYATPAMLREFVEFLVDRRLMAAAARREGLASDPAVGKRLAALPPGASAEALLADAWVEARMAKVPLPSPAEVAAYYDAHPQEFAAPGRSRPLGEVSAGIAERLREEQRSAAAAGLRERVRAGVDVTVVEAALADYLAPPDGVK